MMREAPDLQHRLHAQALRELDEAREWMVTLGRKTAAERVAPFLLLVARHVDPEGPGVAARFELPLSRSDIADFLGLTIETVSRQITQLRKAETIGVDRRQVAVLDPEALEASAGG